MTDDTAVIQALADAQKTGEPVALATVIHTQGSMPRHAGSKMLIRANGETIGTIGGGAMEAKVIQAGLEALRTGTPKLETYTLNNLDDGDPGICGGTAQIFIEPYHPPKTVVIIGGGHVGVAVAGLAHWMGYKVVLSDDRAEYCNPSLVGGLADYVVCMPQDVPQYVTIDAQTYIVAVTRGLPIDLALLPALLTTPAPYIGVIGSRRRWALTYKALSETYPLTDDDLKRLHAPIGLEIGAETPKEIAVSILAEIIMHQRGGTGAPMRDMPQDEK
ncbi:MAG: XdhC family protein [Anaerolineae bacterium]|nr:XdhC family protein [Anaerolineae bacterium]